MAVGAIEMQGQILRTQDYSAMKHQEDNKGQTAQTQIQVQQQKQEVQHMQRVNQSNRSDNQMKRQDARDKGSNEYAGDGGKQRQEGREKRAQELMRAEEDGKVLIKGVVRN